MIKYGDNTFDSGYMTSLMMMLYQEFSQNPLPDKLYRIPHGLEDYLNMLYTKNGQEMPEIQYVDDIPEVKELEENNKVLLAFSGGKDSIASALKLKEDGYEVILYHISGINKSYPNELENAKRFAEKYGFEIIIDYMRFSGKTEYFENPVKNHLILAQMLDKGMKMGVSKYSVGSFLDDVVAELNIMYMLSDGYDFFRLLEKFIQEHILKNYQLMIWWKNEGESITYLCMKHPQVIQESLSCMMPLRYRYKLKKQNEEKFGMQLLDERCGSCVKCCMEYLIMLYYKLVPLNKKFVQHCIEVFRRKIEEEHPELLEVKPEKEYTDAEILEEFVHISELEKFRKQYTEGLE